MRRNQVSSHSDTPLTTVLSHLLVAYAIEFDNEFEHRFTRAGGGARVVSLVMWSNFMRFVGDGIAVGELPAAAGLQKPRALSTLGGMERWRYVAVGSGRGGRRPTTRRDGYGSARALQSSWVIRPTAEGRKAGEIWRTLFDVVEERWKERFGEAEIDELKDLLRPIVDEVDIELPEYLPIVGGADGMVANLPPAGWRDPAAADPASRLRLCTLLSRVLLTYTRDFERASTLSLPLSANVVRVLGEDGALVRDVPRVAGISKEATSMALTFLVRSGYVVVDGASAATKRARLTQEGRVARCAVGPLHAELGKEWDERFGVEAVRRLRSSREQLLERRDGGRTLLSRGLEPYPDGWRASTPYRAHTQAVIDDPTARLPHYPMVLHRGGWPDGF